MVLGRRPGPLGQADGKTATVPIGGGGGGGGGGAPPGPPWLHDEVSAAKAAMASAAAKAARACAANGTVAGARDEDGKQGIVVRDRPHRFRDVRAFCARTAPGSPPPPRHPADGMGRSVSVRERRAEWSPLRCGVLVMITVRRAIERGHAQHGWLDSWHTFSFADYHDPAHVHFRALRVINEDWVQPGRGFGTHGHRDMEIVTWVLDGALRHQDSMGNGSIIKPGEAQYMSAGTGVQHSEFNASKTEVAHLLQIWILPDVHGAAPRYGQQSFAGELDRGGLVPLASPDGAGGSIALRADARLFGCRVRADGGGGKDRRLRHELAPGRHAWLQVARGQVELNGVALEPGDGAAVSDERALELRAADGAEVLLFDLA